MSAGEIFARLAFEAPQNEALLGLKNILSLKDNRIQSFKSGKGVSKRATNSLEIWRRGFCCRVSFFLEKLELLRNVLPNLCGAAASFGERPTHTQFSQGLILGYMPVACRLVDAVWMLGSRPSRTEGGAAFSPHFLLCLPRCFILAASSLLASILLPMPSARLALRGPQDEALLGLKNLSSLKGSWIQLFKSGKGVSKPELRNKAGDKIVGDR